MEDLEIVGRNVVVTNAYQSEVRTYAETDLVSILVSLGSRIDRTSLPLVNTLN